MDRPPNGSEKLISIKKPVRELDEKYVEFVHEFPCAISHCGRPWPVHAHHCKTRGSGGSDLTCIPLCPDHHRMIHDLGNRQFEMKYSIVLQNLIFHFNTLYNDGTHGEYKIQVEKLKQNGKRFEAK